MTVKPSIDKSCVLAIHEGGGCPSPSQVMNTVHVAVNSFSSLITQLIQLDNKHMLMICSGWVVFIF